MNKRDSQKLFSDQPLRNLREYKSRKDKQKGAGTAVGREENSPRCVAHGTFDLTWDVGN